MILVVLFAAGIVLTGCGDGLLSTRADLEQLKNRMDEKGLESSDLYIEVEQLINSIGPRVRMSSAQKKRIKQRVLEIDVKLTELLMKRPDIRRTHRTSEQLCQQFMRKLMVDVTRAKDAAEWHRVTRKNIRLTKTYNALRQEQQYHLRHEFNAYKGRAYITQITLGFVPWAELSRPSVLHMFAHLSRRRAALKRRIKEGTSPGEISPILATIDRIVGENYSAFLDTISGILSKKWNPLTVKILQQIAKDLENDTYNTEILKLIEDHRPKS